MTVEKNNKVTIEYEGRFDNKEGEVFDTSEGKAPLEFVSGVGMVVPGFDNAVIGMEKGEEKEITIKPEEGYGDYKEELKQKVPRNVLPQDQEPKPGMMLMMQAPQGQQMPAKIIEVSDQDITLDINHPLAGKTLYFKIKLIDYQEFSPEELEKMMQPPTESSCGSECSCSDTDPCKTGEEDCKCEDKETESESNEESEKKPSEDKESESTEESETESKEETPSEESKKDEPSIEDLAEGK